MMTLVEITIFSGAMAFAVAAMWLTIAPQWRRVACLAAGGVEQPFHPLEALARAERRIAVRRWAMAPVPAPLRRPRAA